MIESDNIVTVQPDHEPRSTPRIIAITNEHGIGRARREARAIVESLGFSSPATMQVLIAVTELATNLHVHAKSGGELILEEVQKWGIPGIPGIEVVSLDRGPGIADIDLALQDHYSTVGSMGCGLPAVKRLMDEFELTSQTDKGINCGTIIKTRKWLK